MPHTLNLKKISFLIYGLGSSGRSVIRYFKKNKVSNYTVWDDNSNLRKKFRSKNVLDLVKALKKVDFIILSPGISLKKTKYRKILIKFQKKIITDIDLLYLNNVRFKSIVVTGSNGKSTTCKIITHLLRKNKFNVEFGGNIGTPVLDLKIKKILFLLLKLPHINFLIQNLYILIMQFY